MYRTKSVLAVVPARGGSKGVSLKNLRPLFGVSLVGLAARVVQQLPYVDRAVVSTDHEGIVSEAEKNGLAAPFRRAEKLRGDRISDWQVLKEALQVMEVADARRYDVVLMLQPTSPFRTPAQITATLDVLLDGGFDAVWTVSESDTKAHPLKQLVVGEDGALDYYDSAGRAIIARQQLTPVYHRNGVAYAITRNCILESGNIEGERLGAHVIEEPVANIDTELDFALAEFMAERLSLEWLSPRESES